MAFSLIFFIKQLTNQSIYPLNIIVHYGKYTEYYVQGKYYDISDLGKIINVVKFPQKECPFTSKNGHLYILDDFPSDTICFCIFTFCNDRFSTIKSNVNLSFV